MRARLRDVAQQAGATDPAALADGLLMLVDGAFAAARMYGRSSPAGHVGTAARALIDTHFPVPRRTRRPKSAPR